METPILHKPIIYGGALAEYLFLALVVLHVIPALIAPASAVLSLVSPKGSKRHIWAGKYFVRSMVAVAITGIVLDVIRLSFFVAENHTKYSDRSMPSSYPARIGFLYAALCVLYLLWQAKSPYARARELRPDPMVPWSLVGLGVGLTVLIATRYNPWTGALWMVWTFMFLVWINIRYQRQLMPREMTIKRHGVLMGALGAFSVWGAAQGFGPGIGVAISGVDSTLKPYVGDQPGPFGMGFFFFLIGWSLPFVIVFLASRRPVAQQT